MVQSDLDTLLEMGFDRARAETALRKKGGLQDALTWLAEDHPAKDLDPTAANPSTSEESDAALAATHQQQAKSLVCNECGKNFHNQELASYHATKTEHLDFSESTEEIAPLTEEEKKARLEELREKLKAKKAAQAISDQETARQNEKIRTKANRETQDIKEELQRKEQIKQAAKKRQEKLEDIEAKKRVKSKIEADRAERRHKAEEAKAARDPISSLSSTSAPAPALAAAAPSSKPAAAHTETRLRLQTPSGNLTKSYPVDATLQDVAEAVQKETGQPVTSFAINFPRKTFTSGPDFQQTLKEAGLVPSAALVVR